MMVLEAKESSRNGSYLTSEVKSPNDYPNPEVPA